MLALSLLVLSAPVVFAGPLTKDASVASYVDPTIGGGSWLDVAGVGVGEPLNVSSTVRNTLFLTVKRWAFTGSDLWPELPRRPHR